MVKTYADSILNHHIILLMKIAKIVQIMMQTRDHKVYHQMKEN